MKQLKIITFLTAVIFLSACSFGYDIIVVNDSDDSIELSYKISQPGGFDEPLIKSVEDWKTQKSIRRFWTEDKPWQNLPETEFHTDLASHERTIKIPPRQMVNIEHGNYDPISEERGELTSIIELKITSLNGEIFYKGKLLLKHFEKDGYTFIKTYRGDFKEKNRQ